MHVSDPTLALFLLSVYMGLVAKTNVGIVSELSDGSPGCCDGPISQQGIKGSLERLVLSSEIWSWDNLV